MKHTRGRVVDVTTLDDLDRRLAGGARSLAGWRLVRLDLTDRAATLLDRSVEEALFLGCTFADGDAEAVQRAGGVVLPTIPDAPVDPYRASLYAPRELYDTPHYRDSLDARAYAWSQGHDRDRRPARDGPARPLRRRRARPGGCGGGRWWA